MLEGSLRQEARVFQNMHVPLPSGVPRFEADDAEDSCDDEVAQEILKDFFHGASGPNTFMNNH